MKIYVKYCGGCNPRFDRRKLVEAIQKQCPEHFFTESCQDPDMSLIVCGCSAACADRTDAVAPFGLLTLWQEDTVQEACAFIKSIN